MGAQPALQAIAALHQQVQVCAEKLLELRTLEAQARLGELHVLPDQLQEHLEGLLEERRS